jgi:hypothetical protein
MTSSSTTATASGACKACPERASATERVKCTESIRARAYETRATYTVGNARAVYTRADVDFIAAHVVPLDVWYIIPVEVCSPAPMLRFYPHRQAKRMRLEPYREAWHLLAPFADAPPAGRHGIEIHTSADEIYSDLTWLTPRPTKPAAVPNGSPERSGM